MSVIKDTLKEELKHLTEVMVHSADPERIILFGSKSKGLSTSTSDFDFALIFKSLEQVKDGIRAANHALWPRSNPLDLVGLTIDSLQSGRTVLAREILSTGYLLYEKHAT